MTYRRFFTMVRLLAALAAAASFSCYAAPASTTAIAASPPPPLVGAIRWDGYWSQPGQPAFEDHNYGIVTRTTTYDMSPLRWHYRVPFFGVEVNDSAVTMDGDRPEVMGAELECVGGNGGGAAAATWLPVGCNGDHGCCC